MEGVSTPCPALLQGLGAVQSKNSPVQTLRSPSQTFSPQSPLYPHCLRSSLHPLPSSYLGLQWVIGSGVL